MTNVNDIFNPHFAALFTDPILTGAVDDVAPYIFGALPGKPMQYDPAAQRFEQANVNIQGNFELTPAEVAGIVDADRGQERIKDLATQWATQAGIVSKLDNMPLTNVNLDDTTREDMRHLNSRHQRLFKLRHRLPYLPVIAAAHETQFVNFQNPNVVLNVPIPDGATLMRVSSDQSFCTFAINFSSVTALPVASDTTVSDSGWQVLGDSSGASFYDVAENKSIAITCFNRAAGAAMVATLEFWYGVL